MTGEGAGSSYSEFAGEDPSRLELLYMIRKHSSLLKDTQFDEEDAADLEMDSGFWRTMLDLYFIRGRDSKGRQDDLMFFVRTMNRYDFNHAMGEVSSYFVRRWAPKLEKVVDAADFIDVDWRRSFYLNLITHTSYSVTVAICSGQALRRSQAGASSPLSSIYKVVKTVYASPSRVDFQLQGGKAADTLPAYPNICFAIDDFDSTFDAVVLTEIDHCYCVLLNAHDGAAFPLDISATKNNLSRGCDCTFGGDKLSKMTLFSGFVGYKMVREAYDVGRFGYRSYLPSDHSSTATDKLCMRGPGGLGEVEVAVSSIADQNHADYLHSSSVQISRSGVRNGLNSIFQRMASAAKHAYGLTTTSDEFLPMRCCLMSISLPWKCIVRDLLFKDVPPVRL